MILSIVIKSLNEENNIERTIQSCLDISCKLPGTEIILVDSLSEDLTVTLAQRYPINIIQLSNIEDRSCGIGAEIGYRNARGDYIYIVDADMELNYDFVMKAIKILDGDDIVVGVGGIINEMNIDNAEFRGRANTKNEHLEPGVVDRLNGGGVFRKSFIDKLEYLTNKNLHAYEEYELALRIAQKGGKLVRLSAISVNYYGHTDASYKLLKKRWVSKYVRGAGEILRASWGKTHLFKIFNNIKIFRSAILVIFWWLFIILCLFLHFFTDINCMISCLIFFIAPLSLAIIKRKSIQDGIYSLISLNVYTAGLIFGLITFNNDDPSGEINYVHIKKIS